MPTTPAPEHPPRKTNSRKPEKKTPNRKRQFFIIYGVCSALLLCAFLIVLIPLNNWLVNFEAAQPHQQAAEVFDQLFAAKDWKTIYEKSGIQDSAFENSDSFIAYMNEKVGDQQLNYLETSAGLSGDRKFVVRLGEEKIATFTMEMVEDKNVTWVLKSVDLSSLRTNHITIIKEPGQTVYVNGIALDSSYTVRTATTLAEEYLPAGVTGYQFEQQYLGALFNRPEITAKSADGQPVPVVVDSLSGFYTTLSTDQAEMTTAEKALSENAAKAYAKFMIRAINKTDLGKVFDTSSKIYKSLVEADSFVQGYTSYQFEDMNVTSFYRYSDKLISVRVSMTLSVNRSSGGIKTFPMDNTYFFTKNGSGNWMVTNMVNGDVQELVEKVRLTFSDNGMILSSTLVSPTATKLTAPTLTAPDGQVFVGWGKEVTKANGTTVMTIVFTPDEDGTILLSGDKNLEPMDLIAVFRSADGE